MAALITVQNVNDFYDSGKPDIVVQSVIDFISTLDAQLDAANIPASTQKLLKIYACCHQLTLQSGGQVKSAGAMTGDSISYQTANGQGLLATNWGMMLKGMQGAEIIESLFNKSDIQVFSVGRRA